MKSISEYIKESASSTVNFKGFDFEMDKTVEYNMKKAGKDAHNMEMACQVDSLNDLPYDELVKGGCKWVLAYPPHKGSGGDVNYWIITMFIKSKKTADMFNVAGIKALIDLKKKEIVNKDILKMDAKDFKVLTLD